MFILSPKIIDPSAHAGMRSTCRNFDFARTSTLIKAAHTVHNFYWRDSMFFSELEQTMGYCVRKRNIEIGWKLLKLWD